MDSVSDEICALAARLVVEEGLEYGPAKHRAVRQLGLPGRARLPDNEALELAVREYLDLYHADTQPRELQVLLRMALKWMERLQPFRPYLAGAVWRGTATRLNDITIQLFCDDPKSAEIALIDQHVRFDVQRVRGFNGREIDALSLQGVSPELKASIGVHLMVYDYDDLRGALQPDRQGRPPRGSLDAVRQWVQELT